MKDAIDRGLLDDAEAFDGEHLGEAALVLLADGASALLSERARIHAQSCAGCASGIAEQALLASELQVAFGAMSEAAREQLIERVAASRGSQPDVSAAAAQLAKPARGGAWWIAAGLLIAGLASAPSLSGLAKGIAELRQALLVLIAVSVQAEQALRVASGRLEIVRTTASWAAAAAMVGLGLWIARRAPQRANATNVTNVTNPSEGAR